MNFESIDFSPLCLHDEMEARGGLFVLFFVNAFVRWLTWTTRSELSYI